MCPTPKILYVTSLSTGNTVTSRLSLWVAGNLHVRGSCKHRGPKKNWLRICTTKITQLISRHLVRKTRYEADICHVRLLSKASNTGFSRHIKTGCHLLVCITNYDAFDPKVRILRLLFVWKLTNVPVPVPVSVQEITSSWASWVCRRGLRGLFLNHLRWRSVMAEGTGAELIQQSGQDLASWKCF